MFVRCRGDLLGKVVGSFDISFSEQVNVGFCVGIRSTVIGVISGRGMMGVFARVVLPCVWGNILICRGEVASVDSVILGGVGISTLGGGIFSTLGGVIFFHPCSLRSLVKYVG